MILRNARTGHVLADRVERASSASSRLRGLLGRAALAEGEALLLDPCSALHTFFMRFTIDAAFLTRELRVLRTLPGLRPFRVTRFHPRAALALELPEGTLRRTDTREGDLLETVRS